MKSHKKHIKQYLKHQICLDQQWMSRPPLFSLTEWMNKAHVAENVLRLFKAVLVPEFTQLKIWIHNNRYSFLSPTYQFQPHLCLWSKTFRRRFFPRKPVNHSFLAVIRVMQMWSLLNTQGKTGDSFLRLISGATDKNTTVYWNRHHTREKMRNHWMLRREHDDPTWWPR